MSQNPLHYQGGNELVEQYIGTAYDNVKAVAQNLDAINTVITQFDAITTVSAGINDITAVGGALQTIIDVSGNLSDISTTADNAANITAVAANEANINAVVAAVPQIDVIAPLASDLNTVASDITSVTTVAGSIGAVNLVNGMLSSVVTVAGINTEITNLGAIATDISSLDNISSEIVLVANNIPDIQLVAGSLRNTVAELTLTLGSPEQEGSVYENLTTAMVYAESVMQTKGELTIEVPYGYIASHGGVSVIDGDRFTVHVVGTGSGVTKGIIDGKVLVKSTGVTFDDVQMESTGFPVLEFSGAISSEPDFPQGKTSIRNCIIQTSGNNGLSPIIKIRDSSINLGNNSQIIGAGRCMDVENSRVKGGNIYETTYTGLSGADIIAVHIDGLSDVTFESANIRMAGNNNSDTGVYAADGSRVLVVSGIDFSAGSEDVQYSPAIGTEGNNFARIMATV